jgi:membrane-associated phospholipid phosphatase
MAPWGWIAATYGAFMALVAFVVPVSRPPRALIASAGYVGTAFAAAAVDRRWIHLIAPGVLALLGYWLSGLFVRPPQPWLERWLLASDARIFAAFRIERVLQTLPRWCFGLLEFAYSTVYFVVMAGAVTAALVGREAVLRYWTIVLPAELICCAALPFLRCRPPRSIESPGIIATRAPLMRRINEAIVNRGSIQVNTFPSAHVAAALAAGLAAREWQPLAGGLLIVVAAFIAVAAVAGRYHYAVDCALGALVAIVLWRIA